jgi:uncharacterized protein (TIGR03435 family)
MRRFPLLIAILLIAAQPFAQPAARQSAAQPSVSNQRTAANAHASFAVATIKPHNSVLNHNGWELAGNRFSMYNYSVSQLIVFAYSINRQQIVNGPGWVVDDRYDVDGKSDAQAEPNLGQQQEMVRKLLVDRFNLRFHREQREMPVYSLQIAKGGAKLKLAADPRATPMEQSDGHGFETTRSYTSASIAYFILVEQLFADRPLVDQTGLPDRYDFKLNYTYNEADNTDANAPPGLFTAIQQQLGLKFQPTKAAVSTFVIDHIDRPSEN